MSISGVMEPRNAPRTKRTAPRIAAGVVRQGIVGARIRRAVASVRTMWVTPFMKICRKEKGIKGAEIDYPEIKNLTIR